MTDHPDCPHCTCWRDDGAPAGAVNRAAPFYSLVELIDRATPRNQYSNVHNPSTRPGVEALSYPPLSPVTSGL